jgi:hypothetical protein
VKLLFAKSAIYLRRHLALHFISRCFGWKWGEGNIAFVTHIETGNANKKVVEIV